MARALSIESTGTARRASGDMGSYSISSSRSVPVLDGVMQNAILQLEATPRRPAGDENSRRPPSRSARTHVHRTLSGSKGGRPKISSTSMPTPSGALTSAVLDATLCEESTIFGQFDGVAKKSCSACGVTRAGSVALVV